MKPAEERSDAFLKEYHELCTKYRCAIFVLGDDELVAQAADDDEDGWMAPLVYTESEHDALRSAHLRYDALLVLKATWWADTPPEERTLSELEKRLDARNYDPTLREVLARHVAELCDSDPELLRPVA